MKYFLFAFFIMLIAAASLTVLNLEFTKLSDYGKGYMAGNIALIFLSVYGLFQTSKNF